MKSTPYTLRIKDRLPVLGITMGDPAGIGPEIIVKALTEPRIAKICTPVVIGDASMIKRAIEITGTTMKVQTIKNMKEFEPLPGIITVLDQSSVDIDNFTLGTVSAMGGKAAYLAVEKAINLALEHEIDGTVTAPLNKEALHKAGYNFSGHTEIYAHLTKTKDYTMMLVDGTFRVTHVSTHVSLREACDRAKKERILTVIKLSHDVCNTLGIITPSIGVAGLNPHAGEHGLFGREEIEEIIPAIEEAIKLGIDAHGPIPPDSLFAKHNSGYYDIVVAMYHDQGHIPTKLVGFKFNKEAPEKASLSGINITLGLPIIRTSVDHGTAFDVAGKGIAHQGSMIQAIEYGALLARAKLH